MTKIPRHKMLFAVRAFGDIYATDKGAYLYTGLNESNYDKPKYWHKVRRGVWLSQIRTQSEMNKRLRELYRTKKLKRVI